MTEININKNYYFYGKFYDASRVQIPTNEDNWDIIIYEQPWNEFSRVIGSLEGCFFSEIPLTEKGKESYVEKDWDGPVIRRDEMRKFEEKYRGNFVPLK